MSPGSPPWEVYGSDVPEPEVSSATVPGAGPSGTAQPATAAGLVTASRTARPQSPPLAPAAGGAQPQPAPVSPPGGTGDDWVWDAAAGARAPDGEPAAAGDSRPQPGPAGPLPVRVPRSAPPAGLAAPAAGPAAAAGVAAGAVAGGAGVVPPGLPARLSALARLIQIGEKRSGDGVSSQLLADARQLLDRAGERLRLSAGHTVVAIAGGTGSGKSSLFNKLAGADLSTVGVTRPVTRNPHACVWGTEGSVPLLDWLGVPRRFRYKRGSVLDQAEESLSGLVLLDLPDHDSVAAGAADEVDKLVGLADLMVWVLDPQKYADRAVHQQYLVPLAGHAGVLAIVLNQSDTLSAAETEDCVSDLRRLLDSEGLHDAAVLVTSARTGTGIEQLRSLLAGTVSARRAVAARISADLDAMTARFARYAQAGEGSPDAPDGGPGQLPEPASEPIPAGLPAGSAAELADEFSRAAGVSAVADASHSAHELRAADFLGWPVAWPVQRLTGRDPVRRARLGALSEEVRGMTAGPSGAQQAQVDSALTGVADTVGQPLRKPWSQTVRAAVRSQAQQIPAALAGAVRASLPPEGRVPGWWRLVGAAQGVLLAGAFLSLLWIGALLAFGVFAAASAPPLLSDAHLLPAGAAALVVFLLLGWALAAGGMALVRRRTRDRRQLLLDSMNASIRGVVDDMVVFPVERELAECRRFTDELRLAGT